MKHLIELLDDDEMEFFRQLFNSELPITIKNVEIVARVKAKILNARPQPEKPAP